jgi:hypothetical protein
MYLLAFVGDERKACALGSFKAIPANPRATVLGIELQGMLALIAEHGVALAPGAEPGPGIDNVGTPAASAVGAVISHSSSSCSLMRYLSKLIYLIRVKRLF